MSAVANSRRKAGLSSLIGQQWDGEDEQEPAVGEGPPAAAPGPEQAAPVEEPPAEPEQPEPEPEPVAAPAPRKAPAKRPRKAPAKAASEPEPEPERAAAQEEPKYLTMVRREARMTETQADALDAHTRRLNRARRGRGERITWNTLNRVAVDLLLARAEDLAGTTEEELRESLGL